jgi:hypothetical protein
VEHLDRKPSEVMLGPGTETEDTVES